MPSFYERALLSDVHYCTCFNSAKLSILNMRRSIFSRTIF